MAEWRRVDQAQEEARSRSVLTYVLHTLSGWRDRRWQTVAASAVVRHLRQVFHINAYKARWSSSPASWHLPPWRTRPWRLERPWRCRQRSKPEKPERTTSSRVTA